MIIKDIEIIIIMTSIMINGEKLNIVAGTAQQKNTTTTADTIANRTRMQTRTIIINNQQSINLGVKMLKNRLAFNLQ